MYFALNQSYIENANTLSDIYIHFIGARSFTHLPVIFPLFHAQFIIYFVLIYKGVPDVVDKPSIVKSNMDKMDLPLLMICYLGQVHFSNVKYPERLFSNSESL